MGTLLVGAVALVGPATGCSSGSSTTSEGGGASGGAAGQGGAPSGGQAGSAGSKAGQGGTSGAGGKVTAAGAAGTVSGGSAGDTTVGGSSGSGGEVALTCGDGVCDHEAAEECGTCVADCGECPVCGDGKCALLTGGLESCDSCPEDCGTCSECGDGTCVAESGETCLTCMKDCGECASCGDGMCSDDEDCDSCAKDCGACKTCGNEKCEAALGETCSTCADDCGACAKCGDGECQGTENANNCAKDCAKDTDRKGCIVGDFEPYWGGLHAHTHLSPDARGAGSGPPGVAFAHAKQPKTHYDFLWLSDHHNHLSEAQYKSCQAAANMHNAPGKFVAGCGWENGIYEGAQGSAWTGHFNVLFPDKYYKMAINIPQIYQKIADCGPCLGQFNHPPDPKDMHDYEYFPVAQDKVRLVEFNGGASFEEHLKQYRRVLNRGWKVSPSWNEDNHHGGWGDSSKATQVWAPSLSRVGIRAAVAANRTVATSDDTANLKLLADDKCWMGSVLEGLGDSKITVILRDKEDKDGFTTVTLYDPKGDKVGVKGCGGKNPCTVTFAINVKEPTYYFAVARQEDGNVLVSAPVWYKKKP